MECRTTPARHEYIVQDRGYGSMFDMLQIHWFVCPLCNRPDFKKWANAKPLRPKQSNDFYQEYPDEDKLLEYISGLPAPSQHEIWADSGIE